MMQEDDDRSPQRAEYSSGRAWPPDIFLLSRSDQTWTQFQGLDTVADIALHGQWHDDSSRALLWRLLLNVIPRDASPSRWGGEISTKRDEYRRRKADHRVDIAKVVDANPMAANPLFSGPGDDPWKHFYERKEMTDTIKADLDRLFPTGCGDHFLSPARQQLLLSVLSLWADLHPATAYRQGMHEVLAPIVLTLEKEIAAATRAAATLTEKGGPTKDLTHPDDKGPLQGAAKVFSANGITLDALSDHPAVAATLRAGPSSLEDLEADAYWMFTAVMEGLEAFYEHTTDSARNQGSSGGSDGAAGEVAGHVVDSPVVEMCKRLQGSRMQQADPELQRHLSELDISPQLYGMKWARLLFGREFRVEGVLRLWDHVFASCALEDRPDVPECVEVVAVAMVISIRDRLLAEDCTGCLQLLMRYPPDENVTTVIDLALVLGQPGGFTRPAAATAFPGIQYNSETGPQHSTSQWRPSGDSTLSLGGAGRRPSQSGTPGVGPGPAWLIDRGGRGGRNTVGGSGLQHRGPDMGVDEVTNQSWVNGAGGGSGGTSRRPGSAQDTQEMKNNWQHGLDQLTRKAISAAQGVAKLAVQTVERSQGDGLRFGQDGISGADASHLARRLRMACSTLEAGQVPLALREMKEIAQALEGRRQSFSSTSGGLDGPSNSDSRNSRGGQVQRVASETFSTYSDDDGRSDSLYTRDL